MNKLTYILLIGCILNSCSSNKIIDETNIVLNETKEPKTTQNKVKEKKIEYTVLENVDKSCLDKEENKIYQAALNNDTFQAFFSNSDLILYINKFTSEQCPFSFFGQPIKYQTKSFIEENNIRRYTFVAKIKYINEKKALVSYGTPINGWYGDLEVHKINGEWEFIKTTNMSHYSIAY